MRIVPVEAVRYGGHLRISNEGAVRLEVLSALGLSQISPELFPKDKILLDNQKRSAPKPPRRPTTSLLSAVFPAPITV